jgi:hypothetical protein
MAPDNVVNTAAARTPCPEIAVAFIVDPIATEALWPVIAAAVVKDRLPPVTLKDTDGAWAAMRPACDSMCKLAPDDTDELASDAR